MEYPLSEMIDRMTILALKCEHLRDNPELRREFHQEHLTFCGHAFAAHTGSVSQLIGWRDALLSINGKIWELEADIRLGREGILGLEEVGRRALAIRDLNAKRIAIKNEIARAAGGFEEVKIDHASAAAE
jgi:hypothetical protein